ncbi:hypothetical protein D6C77_00015 [Aureobasidium pullulans]|uniref:Transcription initiation factor TFIID subunit 4 n=1 Tax=Aureobasidium pullulans TaxID=5580 RepID=A0A4S9BTX8_AURPU|nr:hypothetical protein D6D21_00088 [Aureobasidium pullulans]THW97311.1 hypothetical protein D6D15_00399 [Aureobasidium pullulans]THX66760.1 hypothetical protein D6D08_07019 [Aureobasidium pullulans]THX83869.1 hypothetical protein D6D04_02766 [Aureobasidium pullulans]THY68827.1 hypothetical protein D6C97_00105 [Aureobasidium pullulans]
MSHNMSPSQQPPPQLPQHPQQPQQQHQQQQQPRPHPHLPQQPHQSHQPMQPASRPYSPYQNASSPTGIALPPAKRPRLSPNPQSPHTAQSPYPPPPALPESPYGNYSPMTAASPPAFNAPQPYTPSPMPGAMGPPPRPTQEKPEKEDKEKITDISDVTDVFHGSGIDLREEENYMTSTYRNVHKNPSFNSSFGSNTTVASPNNSFGLVSQGSFGTQPAFGGSGPISQPTMSEESIQEELDRKHRAAALALNEKRQQHLNDPFLQANNIRHRMHRIAYDQGVALNVEGLYDKLPERPPGVQGVSATGPNGTAAAVKAHGLLQETAPLAEILTLVSLAANERVRSLVDESYAIARGRRYGSHGVVPPNLSDLAIGDNESTAASEIPRITNSAWEKVPEDNLEGIEGDGMAKKETPGIKTLPTKSFTSAISAHLLDLAKQDRDAERERVRKRQERAKRANSAANADSTNGIDPASGPATPSTAAAPASADASGQAAPEKPMTKKERERQAKMGQTEEVLHKNSNSTAALQLGMGKKKKYSWLTGGAPATASNPYKPTPKAASAGSAANGASGGRSSSSGAGGTDKALQARERKWGSWREDGIEGRGIQVRDWVVVLERDGKEKKALQKSLLKLDSSGE